MYTVRFTLLVFGNIILLKNTVAILSCDTAITNKFPCPDQSKCIFASFICDNSKDCTDGSDESYCKPIQNTCRNDVFQCANGHCMRREVFCDGMNDCGDNSDEFFCDLPVAIYKPRTLLNCKDGRRYIPRAWKCNGFRDCFDGSDEISCENSSLLTTEITGSSDIIVNITEKIPARRKLIHWFLDQRKNDSSTRRWGHQLHRIATALYLSNEPFFLPGNIIGEEIGYEITFNLLYKLQSNNKIRTQELALYTHALIVTCSDPRHFFGHDLVAELRGRVEAANYTYPFAILALCNAGDSMTEKDVERVSMAFDLSHRPFWTDVQAIAAMALQCISLRSKVKVDEKKLNDMHRELKKRQLRNGTVDNPITTALVIQALLSNESYKDYFNLNAAVSVLYENQKQDGSWGSVQNSYYVLPALFNKSLVNITTKHCTRSPETEEEVLTKLQEAKGEKCVVQYSIWIGKDGDLGRKWRLNMACDSTLYDIIETVRKIDSRHNVIYNVVDDKPYVSSLYGKQDDSELGMYWFIYVKPAFKQEEPALVDASPVDVQIQPNKEFILWYKQASWFKS